MTIAAEIDRRSLFREVNLRIREMDEFFGIVDGDACRLLCECGSDDCLERIDVPVGVFEALRGAARRFLVAPGHDRPHRDRVVERNGTYAVVSVAR